MTDHMPIEGFQAHDHPHSHSQPVEMPPVDPPPNEVIAAGAQHWLAREFVGGLIAMAQAHEVPVEDFLADKCIILAMRSAIAESEVQVLRTQFQTQVMMIESLQHQLDDCGCHDEDNAGDNPAQSYATITEPFPSAPGTVNGAGS